MIYYSAIYLQKNSMELQGIAKSNLIRVANFFEKMIFNMTNVFLTCKSVS